MIERWKKASMEGEGMFKVQGSSRDSAAVQPKASPAGARDPVAEKLRQALAWALADLEGSAVYTQPEQRERCLERAWAALNHDGATP